MFPRQSCFRQDLVFGIVIHFLFGITEFRDAFELPILEKGAIRGSFRRGFLNFFASVGPQKDSLQHPRDALCAYRFIVIVAGHGGCLVLTKASVLEYGK